MSFCCSNFNSELRILIDPNENETQPYFYFNRIKAEFKKSQVDLNFSSSLAENTTPHVRRRGKNTFNIAVFDPNEQA